MSQERGRLRPGILHSLTAALGAILLPHVTHLPLWCSAACAAFLGLRTMLTWRGQASPGRWTLVALALACALGIALGFGAAFGRDASVALLALMLGLKLLETQSSRDATVCICLGYFLIITNFLYSQTIPTAACMLVLMIWLTATMVSAQDRTGALGPKQCLRLAGTLLLQGLPVMLVLFLLFPRINGPLWGFPQANNSSLTGLSDRMSPGSISNLGRSDAVAFRVEFQSPMPSPASLYWRGPVLWDFDGRTWNAAAMLSTAPMQHTAKGPSINYTVTLEPHSQRWLFAIDLPRNVPDGVLLTGDYQLLAEQPVRARIRYDISSHSSYQYGLEEAPQALVRALRLPEGLNPRARELAQALLAAQRQPQAVVNEVLRMFRTQLFYYTLEPPPLGRHSVDEFLFRTKRGFCEHYASAFVFLMRAAGIPARVVTGYQGGELNPVGDYLIVRQSEAHAWAEVWLRGQGWVRVDPTAAVSPARIQRGIAAAVPEADPLPLSVRGNLEALRSLAFTWDAVANAWNQWVLGYSPDRQMELLHDLGLAHPNWRTLVILVVGLISSVLGALAFVILLRLRPAPGDPVEQLWKRFCAKLARAGAPRRISEGPQDFAQRAAKRLPSMGKEIAAITQCYIGLRYADPGPRPQEAHPKEVRRLQALIRHLRPGRGPPRT